MAVSDTRTKVFKVLLKKKLILYVIFVSKKEMRKLKPNNLYTKSMISGMFDEGGMSTEVKRKKI